MSQDMSKFIRFSIFAMAMWLFSTLPLVITNFFASRPEDHVYGWAGGTICAMIVVLILTVWFILRVRFKQLPRGGTVVASIYIILFVALFIEGFIEQKKDPIVWEGIGPMMIMLCPITITAHFISVFVRSLGVLGALMDFGSWLILGIGYYLLMGNVIFENLDKKYPLALLVGLLVAGLIGFAVWVSKNSPTSDSERMWIITSLGIYGCLVILLFLVSKVLVQVIQGTNK